MFEINRTRARWAFKDLLGQANHFLITILVGLNGVRSGVVGIDDEFRTSWNPRSPRVSADRSRMFALDLALVRAVDALDTYMMISARRPCALPDGDFVAKMDGTGRSVANRLKVFNECLAPLDAHVSAVLALAIEWRNRRVHSLAKDIFENSKIELIKTHAEHFRDHYNGLNVSDLICHFRSGYPPTFKEAACFIRFCHEAVSHFDGYLLQAMPVERYLKDSIKLILEAEGTNTSYSCGRIWDHPKREKKVLRLLRLAGVNETTSITGREVPSAFVEEFVSLQSEHVVEFLKA